MYPGAVDFQCFAHLLLDFALVLGRGHVDKVDHDQAAHVPETQLAGNLFRRFQVGLERGFLNVVALGGTGGVDVNGHQCLGGIDHDGATGGQLHFTLEGGLDLAFNLVTAEQGDFVLVQLDLVFERGHDGANEVQYILVHRCGVNQYLTNVLAKIVAYSADNDVAFLVNKERRLALTGGLGNGLPELDEVVQVPLQLFGGAADAGGTNDDAHGLGHLYIVHGLFQLRPLFTFDTTGNAAGARIVGHEHEVSARKGDKGGEGCTLVATFFLIHLNNDFLTFGNHILDVDLAFNLAG